MSPSYPYYWPEIKFGPINLNVLPPAWFFYQEPVCMAHAWNTYMDILDPSEYGEKEFKKRPELPQLPSPLPDSNKRPNRDTSKQKEIIARMGSLIQQR